MTRNPGKTIWTIGHSNRSLDELVALLAAQQIEVLADIRRFPGSRKHPHFNQEELSKSLTAVKINYAYFPELGGRRKPRPDSINTAWRNESFHAYADYMETGEFRAGIERLLSLADGRRVTMMCSEAVWWRCHRSMIADYFKASGIEVLHIMSTTKCEPHPYTSAARLVDGRLSYVENDPQARLF